MPITRSLTNALRDIGANVSNLLQNGTLSERDSNHETRTNAPQVRFQENIRPNLQTNHPAQNPENFPIGVNEPETNLENTEGTPIGGQNNLQYLVSSQPISTVPSTVSIQQISTVPSTLSIQQISTVPPTVSNQHVPTAPTRESSETFQVDNHSSNTQFPNSGNYSPVVSHSQGATGPPLHDEFVSSEQFIWDGPSGMHTFNSPRNLDTSFQHNPPGDTPRRKVSIQDRFRHALNSMDFLSNRSLRDPYASVESSPTNPERHPPTSHQSRYLNWYKENVSRFQNQRVSSTPYVEPRSESMNQQHDHNHNQTFTTSQAAGRHSLRNSVEHRIINHTTTPVVSTTVTSTPPVQSFGNNCFVSSTNSHSSTMSTSMSSQHQPTIFNQYPSMTPTYNPGFGSPNMFTPGYGQPIPVYDPFTGYHQFMYNHMLRSPFNSSFPSQVPSQFPMSQNCPPSNSYNMNMHHNHQVPTCQPSHQVPSQFPMPQNCPPSNSYSMNMHHNHQVPTCQPTHQVHNTNFNPIPPPSPFQNNPPPSNPHYSHPPGQRDTHNHNNNHNEHQHSTVNYDSAHNILSNNVHNPIVSTVSHNPNPAPPSQSHSTWDNRTMNNNHNRTTCPNGNNNHSMYNNQSFNRPDSPINISTNQFNQLPFTLGPMEIDKFEGDFSEYREFKIQIQSILSSGCFTEPMKVMFLKKHLGQDPLEAVASFMPDDLGAYEEMWKVLDEDFGTVELGFDHHLNLLLSISSWSECKSDLDLKRLYRHVSTNYAAIKHYGAEAIREAEAAKVFIVPLLTGYAANKITKLRESGKEYSIPAILNVLKNIIGHSKYLESARSLKQDNSKIPKSKKLFVNPTDHESREVVEASTVNNVRASRKDSPNKGSRVHWADDKRRMQSPSPPRTKQPMSRYQTPPRVPSPARYKCPFCENNDHEVDNCKLYDDRDQYWNHIQRKRWCSNCLRSGHVWKDCFREQSCKLSCGRADKHVPVLCEKFYTD